MSVHDFAAGVLAYALQSGLLLMVGLLAPRLLALRHPRTLLVYWRALLPTVILLPLLTMIWYPTRPLPVLRIDSARIEEVVATAIPSGATAFDWRHLVVPAALITFLALVRIAVGLVYLDHCRRHAIPIDPLPRRVGDLQRHLGIRVPFVVSERLSVPITFGWARPIVMVPPSFAGLSADQQEGVACHELLHIRRRDWPVTFIEEVLRAVLWFHPAVWVLLSKTALSREQVVDASTVRITGKRRPYLDALWQTVCTSHGTSAALAVPLLGRSHLRARVEHLKKEIVMSRTRIVISGTALAAVIVAAGYVGASVFAASTPPTRTALSLAAPRSTADESAKGDQEGDEKLRTREFDKQCSEITHPVVVEKVNPVYPEEARKEKIMGLVIVETVITDQGKVDEIRVLESPDDRLSAAAMEAIRQWRFEPALCDGEPVSVYYNLTVNFHLE